MPKQTNNLITILAIVLIGYGFYKFVSDFKSIWWFILRFFYPSQDSFWEIAYYGCMILFFSLLIPIGAMSGGLGLLQKKKWGWTLSIIVSVFIFTMNCAGTINFFIVSHKYKGVPVPPIPEGVHVEYVSMIPTYIIIVISLISILLLNCKLVRSVFFESNGNA